MAIVRQTKAIKTILNSFEDEAILSVDLVNKLDGKFNKTTVYRVLERLEQEGILHSFKGKSGRLWYAKCNGCSSGKHTDVHPHFQCNKCGKTECIDIGRVQFNVPNYVIEHSEILLYGICSNCID